MTLSTSVVWEIRDTGNILNGGGFTSVYGGTDYTQQDAAQLSLSDLACANNLVLTSVTGGFTAAMVGNIIYISSGTNFTAGFYEISSYTNTNTVGLDRNPTTGANASVGVGRVGGARTTLEAPLTAAARAGNTFWIKKGTYAWGTLTMPNGSTATPCKVAGYKTVRGDNPTGSDRPAITMSAVINFGSQYLVRDLEFIGNYNGVLVGMGTAGNVINVKGTQNGAGTPTCLNFAATTSGMLCEAVCPNGYAFNTVRATMHSCCAHDSATGFLCTAQADFNNCIVDTCTTGVVLISNASIVNSIIYGCTTGMNAAAGPVTFRILNNIISGCTTGINVDSPASLTSYFDYNVWNNTTDFSAFSNKGPNDITGNPLLTDPANKDFTLQVGSPAINTAMKFAAAYGTVGTYHGSIGIDQVASVSSGGEQAFVG